MKKTDSPPLRMLSLQFELALLIGQELRLLPMLRHFFPPALKAMRCRAVHVWLRRDTKAPLELRYSYPGRAAKVWRDNPQFQERNELLATIPVHPRKVQVDTHTELLQMPMGDVGHCVLVFEKVAINPLLIEATRPIFTHLGTACRTSMEYERAEDLRALASESRIRLNSMLEAIGTGLFQMDSTGNLTFLNAEWSRLIGEEIGTSLGRPMADFIHPADRERFLEAFRLSLTRHGTLISDARLRFVGSATRWLTLRLQGESTDGVVTSVTGTALDITQQRNAERIKREFTATVSHELRTPLTSIDGAISLLKVGAAGPLPDAARELIDIADRNTKRLRVLIDDLLDMEQLLSGKLSISLRDNELRALLEEALREHQPFADLHSVHLRLEPHNQQIRIYTDPDRFQQVMSNLLSNAVKFSPSGGEVSVTAHAADKTVRITVRDHGPGIAPEFHSQIFEKFAQADSSDTRRRGGTGLGLAITKELVELMYGRIGFNSTPGEGATFWFELPTDTIG